MSPEEAAKYLHKITVSQFGDVAENSFLKKLPDFGTLKAIDAANRLLVYVRNTRFVTSRNPRLVSRPSRNLVSKRRVK